MKKMNEKGFTLVEILAVVIILGIIMLVAIPAVTGYIVNTRKEAYLEVAREVTSAVSQRIANGDFLLTDTNAVYYFDYKNAQMEPTPVSPFGGSFVQAYVIATVNEDYTINYYWSSLDEKGYYIEAHKKVDELTAKDVKNTNLTSISNSVYVENKDGFIQIDANGNELTGAEGENIVSLEEANKCFELELLEGDTYSISDFHADNEECYVNKGGSNTKSVNVPSNIDGKNVTKIGDSAFRNKGITEVILYRGITEVGYQAFMDNKTLTSIKMSSTVVTIDDYAFYNCGIQKLILSEGLVTIKQYAFAYNYIDYIYFPTTLKTIGTMAFYHNNLTEIEINSTASVGQAAFVGNNISDDAKWIYKRLADGTYDKTYIVGYAGAETSLVIPEGVKTIGSGAFASLSLTSVSFPSTLETIGGTAFYNNKLTSVTFPEGLKKIEGNAFRDNKITSVSIPNSVTNIGVGVFRQNCIASMTYDGVVFNNSVLYYRNSDGTWDYSRIISGTNGNCNMRTIDIPEYGPDGTVLKTIDGGAFSTFQYTSIDLPDLSICTNLTVGVDAFYHNAVTDVSQAYIYRIKNGTIDYSKLDSYAGRFTGTITVPESKNGVTLTEIHASFSWNAFSTIVIPSGVTCISSNNNCVTNGIITKGTSNNKNFVSIVNKTGRAFDWATITGSVYQKGETFVDGELRHQSGNIMVTTN